MIRLAVGPVLSPYRFLSIGIWKVPHHVLAAGSATFHTPFSGPAKVWFSLAPYEEAFLSFYPRRSFGHFCNELLDFQQSPRNRLLVAEKGLCRRSIGPYFSTAAFEFGGSKISGQIMPTRLLQVSLVCHLRHLYIVVMKCVENTESLVRCASGRRAHNTDHNIFGQAPACNSSAEM